MSYCEVKYNLNIMNTCYSVTTWYKPALLCPTLSHLLCATLFLCAATPLQILTYLQVYQVSQINTDSYQRLSTHWLQPSKTSFLFLLALLRSIFLFEQSSVLQRQHLVSPICHYQQFQLGSLPTPFYAVLHKGSTFPNTGIAATTSPTNHRMTPQLLQG